MVVFIKRDTHFTRDMTEEEKERGRRGGEGEGAGEEEVGGAGKGGGAGEGAGAGERGGLEKKKEEQMKVE